MRANICQFLITMFLPFFLGIDGPRDFVFCETEYTRVRAALTRGRNGGEFRRPYAEACKTRRRFIHAEPRRLDLGPVIPGRRSFGGEPGIHRLAILTAAWVPGSREDARPGMTRLHRSPTSASHSSSVSTATPASRALSSLEPAPGPATT